MYDDKQIIVNRIKTPDGTILDSTHRHDFKCHADANGYTYCVDGGTDYIRRVCNNNVEIGGREIGQDVAPKVPAYEECSIYEDAGFDVIRANFKRGGRGIHGTDELQYVALKDMNDLWLESTIDYINRYQDPLYCDNPKNVIAHLYVRELLYREEHNIKVK